MTPAPLSKGPKDGTRLIVFMTSVEERRNGHAISVVHWDNKIEKWVTPYSPIENVDNLSFIRFPYTETEQV